MKRVIVANDNPDHLQGVCNALRLVCRTNRDEVEIRQISARSVEAASGEIMELLGDLQQPQYDLTIIDILYPGDSLGGIHLWESLPTHLQERGGQLLVVSNSDNPAVTAFAAANNGAVAAVNPSRVLKQKIGEMLGFPPADYSKEKSGNP